VQARNSPSESFREDVNGLVTELQEGQFLNPPFWPVAGFTPSYGADVQYQRSSSVSSLMKFQGGRLRGRLYVVPGSRPQSGAHICRDEERDVAGWAGAGGVGAQRGFLGVPIKVQGEHLVYALKQASTFRLGALQAVGAGELKGRTIRRWWRSSTNTITTRPLPRDRLCNYYNDESAPLRVAVQCRIGHKGRVWDVHLGRL
jgi:hypothetical protein